MGQKKGTEFATIDVNMVTVQTYDVGADEIIFDTANQIQTTISTETTDAVKLIVKGRLIAQKPEEQTITGNQIVLTDNVMNFDLIKILQGGTIKYDPLDPEKIVGYSMPVVGSKDKGKRFILRTYSAIYNEAGIITGYEKTTYPNCQGVPTAFNIEDGTFRAPQYTINSMPAEGESPVDIDIVSELPEVLGTLSVISAAGSSSGKTKITVSPTKEYGNSYMYKTGTTVTLPQYGDTISSGWTSWDGSDDITATTGNEIAIIEVDSNSKALKGGKATVVSAE